MIESTLAGKGLERQLQVAKARGYRIGIVFITLDSPALCIARIRERVAQGGHYVPDEDVRRRFCRARKLFRLLVDDEQLFSNTTNYYSIAGRIVSDREASETEAGLPEARKGKAGDE